MIKTQNITVSQVYGSTEPPQYDLSRVRVPVLLYWGNDDWFSTKENVESLAAQLPRLIATIEVRKKLADRVQLINQKCIMPYGH